MSASLIPHSQGASVNYLPPNFDRVALDDLALLEMISANVLLNGVECARREQVEATLGCLRGPITRWEPGAQLVLPPINSAGTLILHDVGLLPNDDQLRLLAWLEQNSGRTRTVCTASGSLYEYVESGRFIETLYYRLNTLLLDVA
jgi:hypothetical protein